MPRRRKSPLHIAFVWNMHQPFYKDLASNEYLLPWVRLHGVKDYYGMVHILRRFPDIHQTFNLVPSLLKQIRDYTQQGLGQIREKSLRLTLMPVPELSKEDKVFLLANGFMCNWPQMVYPYPRYAQLLEKRGKSVSQTKLEEIQAYFSPQEYLDLQVWANLCWIDPFFQADPRIRDLLEKGTNFREEDKQTLLEVQQEIMGLIIPEYRTLAQSGQIELCTSPLYHPILPLLCDSRQALAALPDLKLPDPHFVHPEDAAVQLEQGVTTFKEILGITPRGMWPPEGAVSEEIVPLLARAGIKWIAGDEQVLAKSLNIALERVGGILKDPGVLYQPYLLENQGEQLSIIFRDHLISDLIGFDYSRMKPRQAAQDMLQRLLKINANLPTEGDYLLSIILDGENAWEYFPNNGRDFLSFLYEGLSQEPLLKTVTVSEYLAEHPPQKALENLFSGSWINHNFKIWIGDDEDNRAWEQINITREALVKYQEDHPGADPKLLAAAWEEIYIAEGSDWFWWYGEEHSSANDEVFDTLFRQQLINVYNMLGLKAPESFYLPNIRAGKRYLPEVPAKGFINPTIDGKVTNYYEWLAAGSFDVSRNYSGMYQAMHQNERVITGLYYGFNSENLFLRVDFSQAWLEDTSAWSFYINFLRPAEWQVKVQVLSQAEGISVQLYQHLQTNNWREIAGVQLKAALDKILEIQLPVAALGLKSGEELQLTIAVGRKSLEVGRWPSKGYAAIVVPAEDFEADVWQV